MDHLKRHANPSTARSTVSQCRYCLTNWESPQALESHMRAHPLKTRVEKSTGFSCLICELRLPGVAALTAHMQKTHVSFDLPYRCGCCVHASSSLRHTVDHFYNEHAGAATLQCPFCMHIYVAQDEHDVPLPVNIAAYLEHLREHVRPSGTRCSRCALQFVHRGAARMHQTYGHCSQNKRVNAVLCRGATRIAKPKYKYNYAMALVKMVSRYDTVSMEVPNGRLCLECDADFEERSHFPGLMACHRCTYGTSCQRAMVAHGLQCAATNADATVPAAASQVGHAPLGREYHCVCGTTSTDGNELAKHLVMCGRLAAYGSAEAAQENTVKRSVLDMLGLMRRGGDDEDGTGGEEEEEAADGEETAGNASSPVAEETAVAEQMEVDAVEEEAAEESQDAETATATAAEAAETGTAAPDEDHEQQQQQHQFNTELSLDDLAAPASVAPPAPQAETDRTPQLSDEYQSLATPRVQPMEHGGGNGGGEPLM